MKAIEAEQAVLGHYMMGRLGGLIVLLCLAAGIAQAQPSDRQVTTINLPGAQIVAMNNRGDVTGIYCASDTQSCGPYSLTSARGFLRESTGAIATFDGMPRAINDAGTVAGYVLNVDHPIGFLRNKKGVITTFGADIFYANSYHECSTYFMAINNREEIAGFYFADCYHPDFDRTLVVTRAKNGLTTSFEVPTLMIPTDINARGDLVAYYPGTEIRGYLVDRKDTVTPLMPESPASSPLISYPVAINNSGDIAGYFGSPQTGFMRDREGTYTIFAGTPIAMNERGDIVGRDTTGHFFLRDASSGTISAVTCPAVTTMNDRGDVAGANVICSNR